MVGVVGTPWSPTQLGVGAKVELTFAAPESEPIAIAQGQVQNLMLCLQGCPSLDVYPLVGAQNQWK